MTALSDKINCCM